VFDKPASNLGSRRPRHVEHGRRRRIGEASPIEPELFAGASVCGDELHAPRSPAESERNTACRRGSRCSGDARDDGEGDARLLQRRGLLRQTPEDCRVAAFEANKRAAWLCEAHEQSVDLVLRDATCTRALPDAEPACPARDQVEDRIADQRVIENDIRGSECVERSHR
jgi:hypothetical protein